MTSFNENIQEVVLKNASGFTQENLHSISFDDFYLFLEKSQAFKLVGEEGRLAREEIKLVGDILLEKFKTAFQDEEVPLLPVGLKHSKAELTSRDNVANVFKTQHENQKNQFNRVQTMSNLISSVYKYHNATLGMNDEDRQESLVEIKNILQPFFTEDLKTAEVPKKKKRFGLF